MDKKVLLIPDGWPSNFFYDQMDSVADLYQFRVLLGYRECLGLKKFLMRKISGKVVCFSFSHDEIFRFRFLYIKYKTRLLRKKQWHNILDAFDKEIRYIYEGGVPDIIHIHQASDTAVFVCEWAKANGIPIVMSEHLLYVRYEHYDLYEQRRLLYEKVDKVFCTGSYQYRALLTSGVRPKSVRLVGNLLDDRFVSLPILNLDNRRILFVASHLADKDIDVLLDAVEFLKNQDFYDFSLDIVGIEANKNYWNNFTDKYNLQQDIENRRLTDIVKILGLRGRKEMLGIYKNYSFLVSSSLSETFGVGVAEAIMNGLPVVCTDSGGIHEFVNNKNGIVVPIRDPKALADAIIRMFETRDQYDAEIISNEIRECYGRASFRDVLIEEYDSLLRK